MSGLTWRPLAVTDLPLLQRWLDEPHVARWWVHDTSAAGVERDFGAVARGEDTMEAFVVALDGVEVGYLQRYRFADEPESLAELRSLVAVDPAAWSIDYFVGSPAHVGRGVGSRMIAALAADAWSTHPDAPAIVVAVASANQASWGALARAGFRRVAEGELVPDNPADPPDHVVYQLDRPTPPG